MLEEFKRIGRFLFEEHLVSSHGGNLSLRVGDKIFITARTAMLTDLKEGEIIEVGLEPGEADSQAALELPLHRAVYKQCEAKAIVHARPAAAIAISLTDNKIVPQDAQGLYLYKAAPIVRTRNGIGSEESVRLLPSFLGRENKIVMLKGYGSFAIGESLEEAYRYTSALENSCRIIIAVRASSGREQSRGRGEGEGGLGRSGRRDKPTYKSAIPPGIGVMDRSRYHKR